METLADVVSRGRDREGTVVAAAERTAGYSYREFATNAWKAGNLLRHYGVRRGATVAVVVGPKDPGPDDEVGWLDTGVDPLLALLGAACVGATVDVVPASPVEARALVAPDGWLGRYEASAGCSRLAYGGPPTDPDVAHFERELWSENPVEPPDRVAADDTVLRDSDGTHTHERVLAAARSIAEEYDLGAGDAVGLDAPLTDVGALAAGVVAPLSVGATLRLDGADGWPGDGSADDLAYVVRADENREGGENRRARVVDPSAIG